MSEQLLVETTQALVSHQDRCPSCPRRWEEAATAPRRDTMRVAKVPLTWGFVPNSRCL